VRHAAGSNADVVPRGFQPFQGFNRDELGTPVVFHQQAARITRLRGSGCFDAFRRGKMQLHARDHAFKAEWIHWLGEVVEGFHLKRLQSKPGMRGDEDEDEIALGKMREKIESG